MSILSWLASSLSNTVWFGHKFHNSFYVASYYFIFLDNSIVENERIWTLNISIENTRMCQLSNKAIDNNIWFLQKVKYSHKAAFTFKWTCEIIWSNMIKEDIGSKKYDKHQFVFVIGDN